MKFYFFSTNPFSNSSLAQIPAGSSLLSAFLSINSLSILKNSSSLLVLMISSFNCIEFFLLFPAL